MNKKALILVATVFITMNSFADIVGIGQVGDKYIYKINGVIASVSVGDIIDGCIVRADSGLQCDDTFDHIINTESAIETMEAKISKFESISTLTQRNLELESELERMHTLLVESENQLAIVREQAVVTINKRNAAINRLSKVLNARASQ